MDYFLARYYSSAQGRFTSVDPESAGAIHNDPQSWNGFGYGRNNPLLFVDPTGETYVISGANGSGTLTDEQFFAERRRFKEQGFTFTGDGSFFESGAIISPDGAIVATYMQVDIDSRFNRFRFEMSRRVSAMNKMIAGFVVVSLNGYAVGYVGGQLMFWESVAVAANVLKQFKEQQEEQAAIASIDSDRRKAVAKAWQQERERVSSGQPGSVNWTPQEREELMRTGKVSGYVGHHSNSVKGSPELAGEPENIKFVRGGAAHLEEHGGNFRNPTKGPLIRRK